MTISAGPSSPPSFCNWSAKDASGSTSPSPGGCLACWRTASRSPCGNWLNHTSGLPDYTGDPELFAGIVGNRIWEPGELVALTERHPQLFAPGSAWRYSNTNYIVAGLLIEAVAGRPLARELDRRIFSPLRLDHTSFPAGTARLSGYHAHGYISTEAIPTADGQPLDVTGYNPSHAWAAGAIVSNTADLSSFYKALLGGRLLGLPPAAGDAEDRRRRSHRSDEHVQLRPRAGTSQRRLRRQLGT